MNNIVLVIMLCLLTTQAQASSKEDSLRLYYSHVVGAEHQCMIKEYKAAAILYSEAFKYKDPFASDIYNSLLCAIISKDRIMALERCEQLVRKGAPLAFFDQVIFSEFRTSAEYLQLKAAYSTLHDQYLARTDQELVEYIRKLVALDQNVHCMLPVAAGDTAFVNGMHNNDDSLALILSDLLQKHNYLNEDVVGAHFVNDTVLFMEPMYGIIALHQIQRGGKLLTDAICDAMKKGYLRSEIGLGWLSQTMMSKLDLTRRYDVYNDTLWKMKETEQQALMFERMTGQTSEMRYAILHDMYLDSENFIVEERVVYNFFSSCEDRRPEIHRSFLILPRSRGTGSVREGHEAEFAKYIHEQFGVLAHK